MVKLQIYADDKDTRLFEKDITITFSQKDYGVITGFSKSGITRILNRLGYSRCRRWKETDWGWETNFIHGGLIYNHD